MAQNEAALATTSTKPVNTCTWSRKSAAFFYSTLSKCPSKEHWILVHKHTHTDNCVSCIRTRGSYKPPNVCHILNYKSNYEIRPITAVCCCICVCVNVYGMSHFTIFIRFYWIFALYFVSNAAFIRNIFSKQTAQIKIKRRRGRKKTNFAIRNIFRLSRFHFIAKTKIKYIS